MKNLLFLLAFFLSLSLYGQNRGGLSKSNDAFFYFGLGTSRPNTSNWFSEFYMVLGSSEGGRVSIDLGTNSFPSDMANSTTSDWLRDSVATFSVSYGRTFFIKKYFMFSAEGGPSAVTFETAKFKEDYVLSNNPEKDFLRENFTSKERTTVGLNLKSRFEFKLLPRLGIILNLTTNLNFKNSYYSYGIGLAYGGWDL